MKQGGVLNQMILGHQFNTLRTTVVAPVTDVQENGQENGRVNWRVNLLRSNRTHSPLHCHTGREVHSLESHLRQPKNQSRLPIVPP